MAPGQGRAPKGNGLCGSLLLLTLLALAFGGWWLFTVFPWEGSIDYSRRPAEKVLQSVISQPIPKGVSDIRVAGRCYPFGIKHWVYIRFSASDQAIEELVNQREPATDKLVEEAPHFPYPASKRYDKADRKRVGWDQIGHISRPEIYSVYGGKCSFVWYGYMTVDRANHLVYVGSNGD